MCRGCGQVKEGKCKVITEPKWIYKHRDGECFARVTPERLQKIEKEIKLDEIRKYKKHEN